MQLEIEGHSNLRFRFRSEATRDEAIRRVEEATKGSRATSIPPTPTSSTSSSASIVAIQSDETLATATLPQFRPGQSRTRSQSSVLSPLSRTFSESRKRVNPSKMLQFPKAVNIGLTRIIRIPPRHFVCLTIGSRGDVQPYIALGLGLKAEGHRVTIVTHEEYKGWIEAFGLQHRQAGGDPGALMKLSVENKV
jgi:sterol 3beta-glucosyltransferase